MPLSGSLSQCTFLFNCPFSIGLREQCFPLIFCFVGKSIVLLFSPTGTVILSFFFHFRSGSPLFFLFVVGSSERPCACTTSLSWTNIFLDVASHQTTFGLRPNQNVPLTRGLASKGMFFPSPLSKVPARFNKRLG